MKKILMTLAIAVSACACATAASAEKTSTQTADVTVNPSVKTGQIKIMNAVNNGPVPKVSDQSRDNFDLYKAACFPYARTHDSVSDRYGGIHNVDISGVFPDFDADVNDPASYDFVYTDAYVKNIQDAGTKVFFRLGQSIENGIKKYDIYPPKDYQKWAEICEHIIRHYTEGWADGFKYDIEYWEIWNEPNLDSDNDAWKTAPRTWGGPMEEFFKFYKVASDHLNKCFPHLKIGGPSVASNESWTRKFVEFCGANDVELDFFSWHAYRQEPQSFVRRANRIHKLLLDNGYDKTESIMNEWNFVKGWSEDYPYSVKMMNGIKGAAFVGATLSLCQDAPVDMLMYYDARYDTVFNGLFDFYSYETKAPYYALYGWHKLLSLGTQVEAVSNASDVYVTAAKGKGGRLAIYLSRYNMDDNVSSKKTFRISVEGLDKDAEIIGHVTDEYNKFTEIQLEVVDGQILVNLHPQSLMLVEIR